MRSVTIKPPITLTIAKAIAAMAKYSKKLLDKKEIVVLNKVDLLENNKVQKIIKDFNGLNLCMLLYFIIVFIYLKRSYRK